MALKKVSKFKGPDPTAYLDKTYQFEIGNFTIIQGDIIRITGEYGLKFQFDCIVTNTRNGSVWVDCYELDKGRVRMLRAFTIDRIKRIPVRRKRVSRTRPSETP
jgi:hypothetical protein